MIAALVFKITELLIPHKYFGMIYWNEETDYQSILGYSYPTINDTIFMIFLALLLIGSCIFIFCGCIFIDDDDKYFLKKIIIFSWSCIMCFIFYILTGNKFVPRIIFYLINFFIWITFLYSMNNVYEEFNEAPNNEKEKLTETSFQTIKDLYKISPQRFGIPNYYKNNLSIRNCSYTTDQKRKTEYSSLVESHTYYLTIHKRIDFIKFYIWAFKLSKEAYFCDTSKKNTAQLKQEQENLKDVISQAQADIDKIRKLSEEEFTKAKNITDEVNQNVLY